MVNLEHFGHICRGPTGGTRHMIFTRCPKSITIDLDTARLRLRGRGSSAKFFLDTRCVGCRVYYQLSLFLRYSGIEPSREPTARNSVCAAQGCERLSFYGYDFCSDHLSYLLLNNSMAMARPNSNMKLLNEIFKSATRSEWTFQPQYNIVRSRMDEILQGRRPGTDLIILDDEFSPASRQL